MQRSLRFLADLPDSSDGWIQIAKQGSFTDPRYGDFAITQEDFDSWVQNFQRVSRGSLPIDPDHRPEKAGDTSAVGWVTDLEQRGQELWAKPAWNSLGTELVSDQRYRFISPSYTPNYKNDEGDSFGTALVGVALTNRPFLEGMAEVSLSKVFAEEVTEPQTGTTVVRGSSTQPITWTTTDSTNANPKVADSRAQMPELSKIAQALELSDDASEEQILDAIKEATKEPEAPKTLDKLADEQDKVVLSKDTVDQLVADAKAGAEAARTLHEQRFTQAFDKALSQGRVDAKDETRENFKGIYELDADKAVALLDSLPKVVNTEPKGSGGSDGDVPEGYDRDRYLLSQKAEAYAEEHNVDFITALEKVS